MWSRCYLGIYIEIRIEYMQLLNVECFLKNEKCYFFSASIPHSCFYFNFEFRVMSFSPTVTWLCHGHVFSCLAFYLLLRRFFARSPRIDPVRIPRFLSSWNSEESNFSGLVEGLIRVKNKFWIFEHDEFSFLEIQLEILENFRWDKGNDSRGGLYF